MVKLLGLMCLLAVAYASDLSIHNAASPSRLPSQYLVSVKPDLFRGQSLKSRMDVFVDKMAAFSNQISMVARYDFTTLSVLHIKAESESLVSQLYSFPEVRSVEANLFEQATDQGPCQEQIPEAGLWGLARISKRQDNNENIYSYQRDDGNGGFAYIVDSGVRPTHVAFGGRVTDGFTAPGLPQGPDDGWGHGTHCAGTVMSDTYGVAKGATAIPVKVLNSSGFGTIDNVIAGLEFILSDFQSKPNTAVAVASISLGFTPSIAMDSAIEEVFKGGVPVTASAGNVWEDACDQSPARAPFAITVMASDRNNNLASFSNFGSCANIIAPGVDVLSAYRLNDNDSRVMSGTSMACPHVAGVLLRYMTQMVAKNGSRPTSEEARTWLINNATDDVIDMLDRPDVNNRLLYGPCDLTS